MSAGAAVRSLAGARTSHGTAATGAAIVSATRAGSGTLPWQRLFEALLILCASAMYARLGNVATFAANAAFIVLILAAVLRWRQARV